MRQFKFRAWDGKQMWYPQEDPSLSLEFFGPGLIPWGIYDINDESRKVTGDQNAIFNTPGILMQFTGMKDHKGKDIYEGDILADSRKGTWIVSWNDNHACFMVTSQESNHVVAEVIDNLNMTVVGNIYQQKL